MGIVAGALAPCLGMGAEEAPESPPTLHPSSLPTGLFNMVFAVLPPWGPWSDNVVPLVRLSRCLIRTANGASLAPRARPPPPAAIPALQLQKQRKDSTPGRCFPPPQEPGTSMQELHGGLDRPQSLAFSLRTSACPAWFLDHWPASREYFQAG